MIFKTCTICGCFEMDASKLVQKERRGVLTIFSYHITCDENRRANKKQVKILQDKVRYQKKKKERKIRTIDDIPLSKVCILCKEEKLISNFYIHKDLRAYNKCRKCMNAINRAKRLANIDAVRAYHRAYDKAWNKRNKKKLQNLKLKV